MELKDVLKVSGVTQGELSRLMKVTEAAVSYWARGIKQVGKRHQPRYERLVGAILNGVNVGDFPLKTGLSRAERKVALITTLKKHLAS